MKYLKPMLIIITLIVIGACSTTPEPLNVSLVATDIAYDTDSITAKLDQIININFVNKGALEHNFIIDKLGIDNLLQSGSSSTISFTLEEAGTYEYYCNVAGHLEAGMKGNIIVTQ